MKFNIVDCYSDYVWDGSNIYDCWAKDTYFLILKNNDPIWIKKEIKRNKGIGRGKSKLIIGSTYGSMRVPRFNFFSFDQKDINDLNAFSNMHKGNWKRGSAKQKIIDKLEAQLNEFITEQIKKLKMSGVVLISTGRPGYPARKEYEKGPYVKDTYFGIAFSAITSKKELDLFMKIGDSGRGWHPGQIVF